jgi:hypothetical protein
MTRQLYWAFYIVLGIFDVSGFWHYCPSYDALLLYRQIHYSRPINFHVEILATVGIELETS